MKTIRVFIVVFLFLGFLPLTSFAQQGPKIISRNNYLRIVQGGKVYPMVEFAPQMPLQVQVQGPSRLIIYIKTAVNKSYSKLPAFRLFVKNDNGITNQYSFPQTTRSNMAFEGIGNFNPSVETHSIPIDVPDGDHTYNVYLAPNPYIIGLASFGYTPLTIKKVAPARQKNSVISMRRPVRQEEQYENRPGQTTFSINPYIMAGAVSEQNTGNDSVYGGAGVYADAFLNKHLVVSGMAEYMDSAQKYDTLTDSSLPSGSGPYILNEQLVLIHALVSYAFLHERHTIVMVGVGWGDLELINDLMQDIAGGSTVSALFNAAAQSAPVKQSVYNINGPVVSALLKLGLSRNISISIRPSYMQDVWNVSGNTSSLLGTPYGIALYPVGVAYDISSALSLAIGYDGRMLLFKDANRFYNGGFIAAIF